MEQLKARRKELVKHRPTMNQLLQREVGRSTRCKMLRSGATLCSSAERSALRRTHVAT